MVDKVPPDDDYIDFRPIKPDESIPEGKPAVVDKKEQWKPKQEIDIVHRNVDILKVRDKIKLMDDIKTEPPAKGDMKVTIEEGVYEVDLNALLNAQITDCPATVIPMLIDQGVRSALDIKQSYQPKKRTLNFNYWWLIILIIGFGFFYLVLSVLGFL